jgi:hypothetical protein
VASSTTEHSIKLDTVMETTRHWAITNNYEIKSTRSIESAPEEHTDGQRRQWSRKCCRSGDDGVRRGLGVVEADMKSASPLVEVGLDLATTVMISGVGHGIPRNVITNV